MAIKNYTIAVIPGDGIGKEVIPEGIRVLEAVAGRFDISFNWLFVSGIERPFNTFLPNNK
jgi:isocitrate/isopropylmalate dehydrogenase